MIRRLAFLLCVALPAVADDRRSTYDQMGADLQAMQDDDMANPGMLWVAEGRQLWSAPVGDAPACAGCHGAPETMRGVAARYPAWDAVLAAPIDLEGRINACRSRHQSTDALPRDSRQLLALEALVALQSRGMPIEPAPFLDEARARGEGLFTARRGQLNLSCASCHDQHAGARLGAATIPQAHPTGYPQYRLEWQDMGGLHRRIGNCLFGIRAGQLTPGDADYIAVEAYLMQRAAGMAMESPAVRP